VKRALLLALTAAVAVAALASIGMTATKSTAGSASAGVPLKVIGGSGAKGLAFFQLRGQTLKYNVVVYNLTPNTRHAVHIHGPAGACTPKARNKGVAVPFPDLRSDVNGVAAAQGSISLSQAPIKDVLRKGFYFNVHRYPTAQLQSKGLGALTCGNITPS
jgi:CHRD domain-containing protein